MRSEMARPGCPLGGPRCPESICDCFIETHPDDPTGLHPEMFIVGPTQHATERNPMTYIDPAAPPVEGGTEEQARTNMDAFCTDLREAGIIATTITRTEAADDAGRFGYQLGTGDARTLDVLMPGVATDQVRYTGNDGQNIWDFHLLYVDGTMRIWSSALKACEPPEGYVRPTVAQLGHGDPNQDHPNPDKCGDPSCDC